MAKKPINILKEYFETGDRPTESQFYDLIDSFIHKDTGVVITNSSYDPQTGILELSFSDNSSITVEIPIDFSSTQIDELVDALNDKVDKVPGKALSTNDYDNTEKAEVADSKTHRLDDSKHVSPSDRTTWNSKQDSEIGKGLSTNDFTDAYEQFLNDLQGMDLGSIGEQGLSAYQVWLLNGNTGTVNQFLDSLVGPQGLSSYEIWIDEGNTGTVSDYLASLIGPKGDKGDPGNDAVVLPVVFDELETASNVIDFSNPSLTLYNWTGPTNLKSFSLINLVPGRQRIIRVNTDTNGDPDQIKLNNDTIGLICDQTNWIDNEVMEISILATSTTQYEWWYLPKDRTYG